MPNLDTLKYDNLFAGDIDIEAEPVLIAANQTINRGDLLAKIVTESIAVSGAVGTVTRTPAASYIKATAEADEHSFYAIAAEDVTTTATTASIIAYKTGVFNEFAVDFGGATANGSRDILAAHNIYLQKSNKQ